MKSKAASPAHVRAPAPRDSILDTRFSPFFFVSPLPPSLSILDFVRSSISLLRSVRPSVAGRQVDAIG